MVVFNYNNACDPRIFVDRVYQRLWSNQMFVKDGIDIYDLWWSTDLLVDREDNSLLDLSISYVWTTLVSNDTQSMTYNNMFSFL